MIELSLTVIVCVTIGVLVVTLLGLLAALISKAARDRRERGSRERFDLYTALLHDPTSIDDDQVSHWCHGGNAEWESLMRVLAAMGREQGAGPLRYLRQRDAFAGCCRSELDSRDPVRRGLALLVLGNLGRPEDCDRIAEFADDPDGDVRLCAIRSLDEIANPQAFAALLELLRPSSQHVVTPLAEARIIERLAKPWAWPYLQPALHDRRPETGQAPESATKSPLTEARGNRQAIALMRAIALSGVDAHPEEFRRWLEEGTVDEKVAAVRALAARCTELPDELAQALNDESPVVRAQAVKAIADVEVPAGKRVRMITQLTQAITDRDWWVRGYAAASLASLGPEGLEALDRVAHGDDSFAAHRAQEQLALHGSAHDLG